MYNYYWRSMPFFVTMPAIWRRRWGTWGCRAWDVFSHLIQLVVHEGLLSHRSVGDALANGRKIIGHFKHSPLATSRLETVQTELGMPVKRLIQDVPTRWNSTFYMTASLLEQKSAISVYAADHQLPATLTANDWTLLEKVNTLLAPFEEITKQISFATSTASEVIPLVVVLKRLLVKETTEDSRPLRRSPCTQLQPS